MRLKQKRQSKLAAAAAAEKKDGLRLVGGGLQARDGFRDF